MKKPAPNKLTELLQTREFLLADGAMGTNLFDLGLANGASSELWNIEEPDKVRSVHARMIEAGADIVLTNSFGANRFRLALHGLDTRVAELNEAAARLAREAADASGREVIVGGSMGPTGDVLEPLGERTVEEAIEAFTDQAEALKRGGVDVAWIETMYAENELAAAMVACERAGLPFVSTMTFDTGGRTMMGIRPEEAPRLQACIEHHPLGVGANCGVGPSQMLDSILGLVRGAPEGTIVVAKANCGLPSMDADMNVSYDGTPESMAIYACMARDCGARIIGGCCGTSYEHLRAMREALDTSTRQPAPGYEEIEAKLGAVTSSGQVKERKRQRRRARG